ncbi:E2F-associated phosphoprotein [Umbelopsis sp. PMI_123]|nr:E2F-associated phosphoprotein [Umbelopsis sp. PMI_123]
MTTTESESSTSKKEYYDPAYFDSDDDNDNEDSSMNIDKSVSKDRQKRREVLDNDELLYNPEEDDTNEDWVAEQLRAIAPSESGRKTKRAMAKTDAILTCPLCFAPVCLSCQRHEIYPNQYRAMFVTNCRPNFAERFRYKDSNEESGGGDDLYYPVNCDICKTHIAMFDREEVYHFFHVIAS